MERQVLLDKLSEFLMVEQEGLQLYRVVMSRARPPDLRSRYETFAGQTDRHRQALVRAITRLGGDPNYVSPAARVAQARGTALLDSAFLAGLLSPDEVEASDLQTVILAETIGRGNWQILQRLVATTGDLDTRLAFEDAVRTIEAEKDTHVGWAKARYAEMALERLERGPAPSPARWRDALSGPIPPIEQIHPAPVTAGLLAPARQAAWGETPIARDMRMTAS